MIFELLIILLVTFFIYKFRKRKLKLAPIDRIPGPPPLPLVGNVPGLMGSQQDIFLLLNYFCTYGKGIIRTWLGPIPFVMLSRADTIEEVLSSQTLINKGEVYDSLMAYLGTGLVTSSGTKWKTRRKLLTPAFHFKILDDFNEVYNAQAKILVQKLQENAEDCQEFNVRTKISLCTLDTIMESSMAWELHAQDDENCEYVQNVKNEEALVFYRISRPWLYPDILFDLFGYGKLQRKYLKILHGQSIAAINRRRADYSKSIIHEAEDGQVLGTKKRRAFLDLMLEESTRSNIILTDEDLREEVDTIMFAGHDTTSIAVSFCLWFLGHNPHIQDRVHEEICEVVGERENISNNDMKGLKLLEACIKEAMRLAPPVPIISRMVEENCTIGGYQIPMGTRMLLNFYALHRDRKYFPDAETFNPDRFLEDTSSWPPYCFVPFSAGARNCIGQKFAMQLMKVMLSWVLRSYEVRSSQHWRDLALCCPVTLAADNGIMLSLRPRRDASCAESRA